jgi:hypothetical protein
MQTFNDTPEFRAQRSTLVAKLAERFMAGHSLDTPESRLEYFDNLGANGFVKLLEDTDRILTKQHNTNPFVTENYNFIVDEADPEGTFELMPAPEDKVPLLENLYAIARNMPYDDPEGIDRIAAFVGFSINAIHPFTEGNGRTARTIYTLLTADDTNRESRLQVAAQDDVMGELYMNPSTFRNPLMEIMQEATQTHHREQGELVPYVQPITTSRMALSAIRPQNRPSKRDTTQLLEAVFHDRHISPMATALLIRQGQLSCTDTVMGTHSGQSVFNITAFAKVASKKDVTNLRNAYRAVSNEYTMLLMKVMSGTQSHIQTTAAPTIEHGVCVLPPLSLITQLAKGQLHLDMDGYSTINDKIARNEFIVLD